MSCTTTCVKPSPSQAHCSVCHLTWSGIFAFDRHRKDGECRTPAEIGYADDGRGVFRAPMTEKGRARLAALADSRRVVAPQTADSPLVGVIGRPEVSGTDLGRSWGEHPPHPTCVDVTTFGNPPGSEWMCGPDCPLTIGVPLIETREDA